MPLLHFLGVSPASHFSIAFTFMPNEVYGSYKWATDAFEDLILSQSNYDPEVILTDNEDAVKAAAEHTWPSIPQLLCVWHVNQNVLTHAQKVECGPSEAH
jgi:hypothetical protein